MDVIVPADFSDDVLVALNAARSGADCKELQNVLAEPVNDHACSRTASYPVAAEEGADEAATKTAAVESLRAYLADEANATSENYALALAPRATHCAANIVDGALEVCYQFKYLELPGQGPAIDGALVVQGNVLDAAYAPVLCVATYQGEGGGGSAVNVGPWDLMYEPSNGSDADAENAGGTFTVPVQGLPAGAGSVRVQMYVTKNDAALQALYAAAGSEEAEAFMAAENLASITASSATDAHAAYVCALDFTVEAHVAGAAEAGAEGDASAAVSEKAADMAANSRAHVTSIKIAVDFDEISALRAEGYDLACQRVGTDGMSVDDEGAWPFHIMSLSTPGAPAVTAVDFVTVSKAAAAVEEGAEEAKEGASLPAAFEEIDGCTVETHIHCDLATEDAADSIFLRVTTAAPPSEGETPVTPAPAAGASFNQLTMLVLGSADTAASDGNAEEKGEADVASVKSAAAPVDMDGYVAGVAATDKVFVSLPEAVASRLGCAAKNCGLLLHTVVATANDPTAEEAEADDAEAATAVADAAEEEAAAADAADAAAADDDNMSHLSGDDEEEVEDMEAKENELADQLEARLVELQAEQEVVLRENEELQKRAIILMARERAALQGQSNKPTTAGVEEDTEAANERIAEKEKLLQETLNGITASRAKVQQQTSDYDQLAHDLQTRLDDREYKANEISESFAAFKSEILSKAENTRTSKPLSKKLIKQFEVAQNKREEDLERVRLRNISMRTGLLRSERQLRNREQLAEGLHMIDFEQLKVENQTLYEKIEERTEELTKLNRKKTNTVQVLTHVREKLRFIEKTNLQLNRDLSVVENSTMGKRGTLTDSKKTRDSVREDNKELKRKQGFASSSGLLTDYESRTRGLGDCHAKLAELRSKYDMLATALVRDEEYVASMKQGRSGLPSMAPTPAYGSGAGTPAGMGNNPMGPSTNYPGGDLQPTTPYFPGAKPDDEMPYPPLSG